jgi:hypothetical protein
VEELSIHLSEVFDRGLELVRRQVGHARRPVTFFENAGGLLPGRGHDPRCLAFGIGHHPTGVLVCFGDRRVDERLGSQEQVPELLFGLAMIDGPGDRALEALEDVPQALEGPGGVTDGLSDGLEGGGVDARRGAGNRRLEGPG